MTKEKRRPAARNRQAVRTNLSTNRLTFNPTPVEVAAYYAARIADLKQRDSGEWRGRCPIHLGDRDSFAVNPKTGEWYCHSECGRGGDMINLEMELSATDFKSAKAAVLLMTGRVNRTASKRLKKAFPEIADYSWTFLDQRIQQFSEEQDVAYVASYAYRHSDGRFAYVKVKFRTTDGNKTFQKYAPTEKGGWTTPAKAGIPRLLYNSDLLADADEIHLCNGEKAANAGRKLGLTTTCLPDGEAKWDERFTPFFTDKHLVIYLDNDAKGQEHGQLVAQALFGQVSELRLVNLPDLPPKGDLYDWIKAGGTFEKLKEIIAATPVVTSSPDAGQPSFEFMDAGPLSLTRPLDLIEGSAYAVSWLWVQQTAAIGGTVRKSRQLVVVREDGTVFGVGGDESADMIGFDIGLGEPPREDRLWRAGGVKAYRAGARPDYADVFRRVAAVYDHFIDFNLSVADQTTMCEFSTCASMITWFSAAFTVLGYVWPTGEKGSGKTQWGTVWAMTSYLGEVLLSSTSFAAIRDLANYGGALLFDDAEIVSDPKRCDPNKRELLLAGNRRGATVMIKEPNPNGGWATKRINAYCPRGFTAIRTPDPVLSSRTIAIPLVRTANAAKGNADPADIERWPCDHRQLVDDLWATALTLLSEARQRWAEFDHETASTGREFEPWRAIMAVARLFENHGVEGLEGRMRELMEKFRTERPDIMGEDRTVIVIRALINHADIKDISDVSDIGNQEVAISASEVAEIVKNTAQVDETLDVAWATARSVGRMLSRLRLRRDRESNKNRDRKWKISKKNLIGLGRAYGIISHGVARKTNSSTSHQERQNANVRNARNVQNVRRKQKQSEFDSHFQSLI